MTDESKTLDPNWAQREGAKFSDGTYIATPWQNLPWFNDSKHGALQVREPGTRWSWVPNPTGHFAHVAKGDQMKIAFTESDAKGQRDVQTVMKPGKYLTRFFKDVLTEQQIREYAEQWAQMFSPIEVQISDDPDVIERVYVNGPNSCMSHSAASYAGDCHPARVYGAPGDLAVAFIGDAGNATGRAIVWPSKKVYGRIYGDDSRMTGWFERNGWSKGYDEFRGARLNFIPSDKGYAVMPYLDFPDGIKQRKDDNGTRYWEVLRRDCGEYPDYHASNTCGTVEDADTTSWSCDRCGDGYSEDDSPYSVGDECWCEDCYSNYAETCNHCGETYNSLHVTFQVVHTVRYREQQVCEECCSNHYVHCEHSDGEYHDSDNVLMCTDGEYVAERDASGWNTCSDSGDLVPNGDDCDCDHCTAERAEAEADDTATAAELEAEGQTTIEDILRDAA